MFTHFCNIDQHLHFTHIDIDAVVLLWNILLVCNLEKFWLIFREKIWIFYNKTTDAMLKWDLLLFFFLSLVWKQIFKLMIYSVGKKCKKFDPLGTFWFVNMLTEFLMLFGMEVLPNFVFTRFQILAVKIEHL